MNVTMKNVEDRATRSHCCDSRVQVRFKTINSRNGCQLDWGCNACGKIHVLRDEDEQGGGTEAAR